MIGKIGSGMLVMLFSVCMVALFSNVRTVHAQTPKILATPNPKTLKLESSPAPPYPRYNFSIMAENMPQLSELGICVKSSNTTIAKIVN
jgi:hypothetical protein